MKGATLKNAAWLAAGGFVVVGFAVTAFGELGRASGWDIGWTFIPVVLGAVVTWWIAAGCWKRTMWTKHNQPSQNELPDR